MPDLLCSHRNGQTHGWRYTCRSCGSFIDLEYHGKSFPYETSNYAADRCHFDEDIGSLKVTSARRWLAILAGDGIDLKTQAVMEVGFGGGQILRYMAKYAQATYGIEASQVNLDHARSQGAQVFHAAQLPPRLPYAISLWMFLDSFEHLERPASFLEWMRANSTPSAHVFLVLPEAGSISQQLFGKLWPHRLPDHQFHWSAAGLTEFFSSRGYQLRRSFFPWKTISGEMVFRHLNHKLGWNTQRLPRWLRSWSFPFNIGERAYLFRMKDSDAT